MNKQSCKTMTELHILVNKSDMTKRELSEISGIPLSTTDNWWNQGIDPRIGNVEAYAKAMGYDIKFVKREASSVTPETQPTTSEVC